MWPAYRAAIAGVGESAFEWRSERTAKDNILIACRAAIADAGLTPADIDGVALESKVVPEIAEPDEVLADLGVGEWGFVSIGGVGGAGVVGALEQAALAIAAGSASAVLCWFGAGWGADAGSVYDTHGRDPFKRDLETPAGFYGQATYFAMKAHRYRFDHGLAPEQLGAVAIAARDWAGRHPGALRPTPLTMEGYLASRFIAEPLRAADCSIVNDGAAAIVVTAADRWGPHAPAYIAGAAFAHEGRANHSHHTQSDLTSTWAAVSGPRAMERAGVAVDDIDVFELYDCFTITTLLQLEDLGVCSRGSAGKFVEDGRIGPGGDTPVNTHGGLLCHSYMLSMSHIVEAVHQLRGTAGDRQVADAELALVTGYGGTGHATAVLAGRVP